MAILEAEKIFVDSSDDITTVIERVSKANGESLILVIPQNSGLFTSVISLKILYRRSMESRKDLIVVTEDVYGGKISQQAGFIFVNKVSQITSDLWDIVKEKNLKTRAFLDGKGKTSLGTDVSYKEVESVINSTPEVEEEIVDEHENEVEPKMMSDLGAEEKVEEHDIEIDYTAKDIDELKADENAVQDSEVIEDIEIHEKPVEEKSNVVTIKGIQILSGGDIAQKKRVDGDAKIDKLDNSEEDMESNRTNSFTGRDFTKVRVEKTIFDRFFDLFRKEKKPEDRFEDPELAAKMSKRKRNQILAVAGIVIFFLLIIAYMTVFNWSSVQVNITLKKEEVLATETVRLRFDEDFVYDEETPDVIPATEIQSEEQTTSGSATASGDAKTGTKATGKIYVINNTTDSISIPAGTLITDTISGLDFVIKQTTNLKAGTLGDDNTVNAETTSNIGIEAATFGEEFNITNPQFVINGFENLVADIDVGGDLKGGFAENVTVVSQENVEALQDELVDQVQARALSDLETRVPSGFTLIEESVEYSEPEVTSNPSIGSEPNSSGTFDVTVVMTAIGIIVRNEDVDAAITSSLASSNAEEGSSLQVNDLQGTEITEFTTTGNDAFITIGATGDVTNQLTEEEIEELIGGESIKRAQEILEEVEIITSAEINYSPALVPSSFRSVPSSPDRINVKFE